MPVAEAMIFSGGPSQPSPSDREEAADIAGFLREVERKYGDADRRDERLRATMLDALTEALPVAARLLGERNRAIRFVNELSAELMAKEALADLVQEDAAYIARALEVKYLGGRPSAVESKPAHRRGVVKQVDGPPR